MPTRDPFGRGPLVVTAMESAATGIRIEGRFSLGWVGQLSREQLDFVGLLLSRRNNLQQLADDLGVAYNTARARLDDIVGAVVAAQPQIASAPTPRHSKAAAPALKDMLERLAAGELTVDEAEQIL